MDTFKVNWMNYFVLLSYKEYFSVCLFSLFVTRQMNLLFPQEKQAAILQNLKPYLEIHFLAHPTFISLQKLLPFRPYCTLFCLLLLF